jgi:hypothetical protein
MGFTAVCHECGEILYEGMDVISLYPLRAKYDCRCPACGRKTHTTPLSITHLNQLKSKYMGLKKIKNRY